MELHTLNLTLILSPFLCVCVSFSLLFFFFFYPPLFTQSSFSTVCVVRMCVEGVAVCLVDSWEKGDGKEADYCLQVPSLA